MAGDDGEGVGAGGIGAGIGADADTFRHLLEVGLADHALETSGDRLALVRRRLELGLSRGGRTRGGKEPETKGNSDHAGLDPGLDDARSVTGLFGQAARRNPLPC
jgi:hypothetical protein